MHIVAVDVCPLSGATVDGGWPQGHEAEEDLHTLIKVATSDGLTGWGSCFTSGDLVAAALKLLWPLLKGQSGVEPERVSESLHQATFWQGRGGTVTHAISGIDIALWDILGQACGQPVSRLLGGNHRDRIRPYGSILFDEPDVLARRLEETVERGFRSIKMGWRPFGRRTPAFDETLIRTARSTVGDEIELMVDAGGSEQFWPHGPNWARRTSRMLADHNITWFEEPLPPDDIDGFTTLTANSPVPIAGGEVLTRRQSFQAYLKQRAVDIIQPDVTKCGGLSEFRRVAHMAEDHNVQVIPHGWNTAIGLAADLQISAFLPNARYVEYLTPCAYIEDLLTEPIQRSEDGSLQIPNGPGLGVQVDPKRLIKYCPEPIEFR